MRWFRIELPRRQVVRITKNTAPTASGIQPPLNSLPRLAAKKVSSTVRNTAAPGTTVDGSIEGLSNLNEEKQVTRMGESAKLGDDTRVNGKFGFAAKIGKSLAVQTSIELKYDHRPSPLVIKNLAKDFIPKAAATDTVLASRERTIDKPTLGRPLRRL